MSTSKRPRKKPAKRPSKKAKLIHFTAMHKGTARPKPPRAGKPGDVWVLIGKPTWMKYKNKGVSKKTKTAALRALKKFKMR